MLDYNGSYKGNRSCLKALGSVCIWKLRLIHSYRETLTRDNTGNLAKYSTHLHIYSTFLAIYQENLLLSAIITKTIQPTGVVAFQE